MYASEEVRWLCVSLVKSAQKFNKDARPLVARGCGRVIRVERARGCVGYRHEAVRGGTLVRRNARACQNRGRMGAYGARFESSKDGFVVEVGKRKSDFDRYAREESVLMCALDVC